MDPAKVTVDRRTYWLDLVFGRLFPALIFSIFLINNLLRLLDSVRALQQPQDYLVALQEALALAYFVMLVVLYSVRLPKVASDRRPGVAFIAFTGTFSVIIASVLPGSVQRSHLVVPGLLISVIGLAYSVWGLAYLRRSFSIMPEARHLVTGGPYGLSRHPVYLGEVVTAIGIYLASGGWPAWAAVAYFLGCQFLRMRWEEGVLMKAFPDDYPAYARRTGRYLPGLALLHRK